MAVAVCSFFAGKIKHSGGAVGLEGDVVVAIVIDDASRTSYDTGVRIAIECFWVFTSSYRGRMIIVIVVLASLR